MKPKKHLQGIEYEFLQHSNWIEGEYGQSELGDAIEAWRFAKRLLKKPLTVKHILKIHKLLLKNRRPDIAGKLRDCAVWIGGEYKPVELPFALEQKLENWIRDYWYVGNVRDSHIAFEHLHPFTDGNGRVGRILYNVQRMAMGLPIHIIHEGEEQQEYYIWFK